MVALCLVILSAVWQGPGKEAPAGETAWGNIEAGLPLTVMGQVYQKEGKTIYLQSVTLWEDRPGTMPSGDPAGVVQIYGNSALPIPLRGNLICELQEGEGLEQVPMGSMVVIEGIFAPFSRATNPGEFDQEAYYRILHIEGRLRKAVLLARGQDCWPVREGLFRLRQCLHERLYRIFPQREAAVMCALLLGEKGELDQDLKALYKRSGILHIFSISSLHITILGMSVYRLLRRLRVPVWVAAVAGSLLLLGYGCLAGFGVSACRAIGMYLIRMLGEILGRTYDLPTALGLMAAVMVWRNPLFLQHSGFLLSFASVAGIVAVAPVLFVQGRKKARGAALSDSGREGNRFRILLEKVLGGLRQSAAASTAITLTTLPVQLWFYYEVPVYAVGINLLVLPFMKLLMFAGILALVPGFGYLGLVDRLVLLWYERLCGICSRLPFASWNPGRPSVLQVWVYYLVLGSVVLVKHWWRSRQEQAVSQGQTAKGAAGRQEQAARGAAGRWEQAGSQESAGRWKQAGKAGKRPGIGKKLLFHRIARMADPLSWGILAAMILLLGCGTAEQNRVIFLDVGQGDCILVETASGETYLFDCGSSSRTKVGQYVVLPFLKFSGIHRIDAVFLSHPDADHVNGARELLAMGEENGIRIGQLVLPDIEKEARMEQLGELLEAADALPVRFLGTGASWDCKSAVFTCLHPTPGYGGADKNAYSLCVYVEFLDKSGGKSGQTLLLTGDVAGEGEEALTQELVRCKIQAATILKAAHHGSSGSTSQTFLDQVRPQAAVISCGRNNRYGHPHSETLERLEEAGCLILRTDQAGAVTAYFEEGGVRVDTYRE